jgi:putative Mg2+ transporter-C (MgtC) family protein
MLDHWEILDVYKALFAIAAGFILGLEREMKDKAAGLKTITIICLGACLFAIISYKVGGSGNATAIAAYIVSGVGFLGAGAIFKDGGTVSGLTTAGIIWLAAAVGTAIGFGEFYLAGTFILASLIIVAMNPLFTKISFSKKLTRQLQLKLSRAAFLKRELYLEEIKGIVLFSEVKKIEMNPDWFEIQIEVVVAEAQVKKLQDYLGQQADFISFSL